MSTPGDDIAWLVNAQDCLWGGHDQQPGRDMSPGKLLHLERGLAEIEFDQGTRVILQGPAGLEFISASSVKLNFGTLTARVPPQARGFSVLTSGGKVVDLGTEFGLSVDRGGRQPCGFSREKSSLSPGGRLGSAGWRESPPEPDRSNGWSYSRPRNFGTEIPTIVIT